MEFIQDNLLAFIVFFPALAGLIILMLPNDATNTIRRLTFLLSLVPLIGTLVLWFSYNAEFRYGGGFAFEVQAEWFPALGSSFHIGLDGISLVMFLLTTMLTPLAILASFNIKEKVKMYMFLFLIMEMAMLGLFASLDLLIFFIFWEFGLVPMYFLIRLWGGVDRNYASFKFMIYTMAGSLGLLLSIQVMGLATGTYDIIELMDVWVNLPADATLAGTGISVWAFKNVAFWAFVLAFAIKVPIWPFHTWLPDAHTQAPVAGSMMLAGVLLKLGAYGFLRLVIPLFPEHANWAAGTLATLGMLSIVMGGYAAFGQWNFKRLVAYSSINHMGFVVLGLAVTAYTYGRVETFADPQIAGDAIMATNGAIMQMFNHGISAAAMFFLVGVLYERTHTLELKKYGGIWAIMPIFGAIFLFTSMSSLGLPGLNGFVGEYMVAQGSWDIFTIQLALSMLGLLMTGAYILKALGTTLHGPVKKEWMGLKDMTLREHMVIWPLMVLMLTLGIWPQWVLVFINDTVTKSIFGLG